MPLDECLEVLERARQNIEKGDSSTALLLADQALECYLRLLCLVQGCDEQTSIPDRGKEIPFSRWGLTQYVKFLYSKGSITEEERANFFEFHQWRNSVQHSGLKPSAGQVQYVVTTVEEFGRQFLSKDKSAGIPAEDRVRLIDDIVSARSLLQLLGLMDKIVTPAGGTKKNERLIASTLYHLFCPIGSLADRKYLRYTLESIRVLRNIQIGKDLARKIFGKLKRRTELDLLFFDIPSSLGRLNPTESTGTANVYVEVEMGDLVQDELFRLGYLKKFFKSEEFNFDIILVSPNEKSRYDEYWNLLILNFNEMQAIGEAMPINTIMDIPGMSYDWAAIAIQLLQRIFEAGTQAGITDSKLVNALWTNPHLRQYDFETLIEKRRFENENHWTFGSRIGQICRKLLASGLITMQAEKYWISADGRDVLTTYTSFGETI